MEARITALEASCASMRQTLDGVMLNVMTGQLLAAERAILDVAAVPAHAAAPPAVTAVQATAAAVPHEWPVEMHLPAQRRRRPLAPMQHEQVLAHRRALYHANRERMRQLKRDQRLRAMLRPTVIVI